MPKDLLLDESGELQIKDGDFVIGESSLQHQRDLLLAYPGEFKEHPEVGVGIRDALLSERPRQILERCKRQFQYDGQEVRNLTFTEEGQLIIDAKYI